MNFNLREKKVNQDHTFQEIYPSLENQEDHDSSFDQLDDDDLDEGCLHRTAVKDSGIKAPLQDCVEINLLGLRKHLATSMGHSTEASVVAQSLTSTSQTVAAKLKAFTEPDNYSDQEEEEDMEFDDANVCETSRSNLHARPHNFNQKEGQQQIIRCNTKTLQNTTHRTVQQFLRDQERYSQERLRRQMQRVEECQIKSMQGLMPVPVVNSRSKKLAERKLKSSCGIGGGNSSAEKVHTRLYTASQEKKRFAPAESQQSSNAYDSRTMNRSGSSKGLAQEVSKRLHKEAQVREKSREQLKKALTLQEKEKIIAQKPPTSRQFPKTMKYAEQRFIKDFENAMVRLFNEFRESLRYEEFVGMSQALGFIKPLSFTLNSPDKALVDELWKQSSQETDQAKTKDILELFLIVEGFIIQSDNISFVKRMNPLKANRQHNVQKTYLTETLPFKPRINKSSEKLAQARRERIQDSSLQLLSSQSSHHKLKDDKLLQLLQIPASRKLERQTSEERELVKCTFHPEILSKSTAKGDRCVSLFQKSTNQEIKADKSTVDYEFEKQEKECTFQPKLLTRSSSKSELKSSMLDFNKLPSFNVSFTKRSTAETKRSVSRQQQPRQSSGENIKKRPVTILDHHHENADPNLVNLKIQHSLFESLRPLIYVDVNIAPGRSERISVFQGDTAAEIAQKFSLKHGLDFGMRVKLEKLLDSQISTILMARSETGFSSLC